MAKKRGKKEGEWEGEAQRKKKNNDSNITRLIRLLNYSENDSFRSNQKVVPISHPYKIYIPKSCSQEEKCSSTDNNSRLYHISKSAWGGECERQLRRCRCRRQRRKHTHTHTQSELEANRKQILFHILPKNSAASHSFTSIKWRIKWQELK